MNEDKLSEINNKVIASIYNARKARLLFERNIISKLPQEHRFLFKYNSFDINQLISLCVHNETNYKQILSILIFKNAPDSIKGIALIGKYIKKPAVYTLLLAFHPASKVKVKGIPKYMVFRLLRNNKFLLDLARKIYNRMRG
ncbi:MULTISPECIES: hypothetical protein [Enterobacteriaceae]|mgnify:CR=1 FL=1|uniref:hypothetical protein n=1 Tax=Enterobacteriaceae TaxID=543 RepID=UPI0015DCB573|nr:MULTISPECIES: hypothetical protein [unclassified Klebsiella]HAT3952071.1 hypothetical protein [Kluyvera ascorbata]BBR59516.1 hypothetical protein WP4W18E05_28840 [Klebsiella sp. WP4-W18-ESBL-05]BBS91148.1 hypothetical protein WP7S18C02_17630 [Klebsiella sp. WP7-S18-CRE-02]BBS96171.1 hypothetical protein WP7S18C03_17640 [Klebsiella sp. WP7-S18-CRE-03]BBT01201.1 hypothetical protein WP7S18E04_17630 [Klebsiella sp. WP7-S18-ESBL-04]